MNQETNFSIERIFVVFRTEDDRLANTDAPLLLIVNTAGEDVCHDQLKPASNYARRGFCNLFEIDLTNDRLVNVDERSYFRIEIGTVQGWLSFITGDYRNEWKPRRILIWGVANNLCVPLAFVDKNETTLAEQHNAQVSIPVPRIELADDRSLIHEVLVVIETAQSPGADTAEWIELEICQKNHPPGAPVFLRKTLGLADEKVFDLGLVTIFRLLTSVSCTVKSLIGGVCRFTNYGTDDWLPKSVFVFGMTQSREGNSPRLACLLACPNWGEKPIKRGDENSRSFVVGHTYLGGN